MARTFANQTSDRIDYSGSAPILYNQTNASVMAWFKRGTAATSGRFHAIFIQQAAFNEVVNIQMATGDGANEGRLSVLWRTPSNLASFVSANAFDNDAWHWVLFVRNSSSPYVELFVDGVSEGSSTTDPGTDASNPTDEYWGNDNAELGSFGGELARCAFVAGTSLTVEQARSFMFGGFLPVPMSNLIEMVGGSPEPDWSGVGNNGAVTNTSVADHPPIAPLFHDFGDWPGAFTAAAVGADVRSHIIPAYYMVNA